MAHQSDAGQGYVRITARVTVEVAEKLEAARLESRRSLAAEAGVRIEQTFKEGDQ